VLHVSHPLEDDDEIAPDTGTAIEAVGEALAGRLERDS
jgi:hypothetical protein